MLKDTGALLLISSMTADEHKTQILIAALEERYKAIHIIRDRVQSIGIWSLGLLLGASAWIIQSEQGLDPFKKTIYIIGALSAAAVLRFDYLEDLKRGFKGQQRVAARLEKALGLYDSGKFDASGESIYPKEWERAGTETGNGKFFATTYNLLYVSVGLLVIAILSAPCW